MTAMSMHAHNNTIIITTRDTRVLECSTPQGIFVYINYSVQNVFVALQFSEKDNQPKFLLDKLIRHTTIVHSR